MQASLLNNNGVLLSHFLPKLTLLSKYMIIPWQELEAETLDNIVESVILREGTDYGIEELSLNQKKTTFTDSNSQWNCGDCMV